MLAKPSQTCRALVTALAGLATAPPAAAENVLTISDTSVENLLEIDQGPSDGNLIAVDVSGNRNGGAGTEWARPVPDIMGNLYAGTLTQVGSGNRITLGVVGTDNLFAVTQTGTGNLVQGAMQGVSNIAAVRQSGQGHVAVFRQTGSGNTVAISQSTW